MGAVKPITITGPNEYMTGLELKRLIADFIARVGDLALEQLDAAEVPFARIGEALTSLPFLASTKMVVLRNPSKNKEFSEQADVLLKGLPATTELVLTEQKFDKRSSLYKLFKKQTDFREFAALEGPKLQQWVTQQATIAGAALSGNDARYLIDRVGPNQQQLFHEIEKLSLGGGAIDRKRIDNLTEAAPQSTIFQLIDAAVRGDAAGALKLYDEQRAMKVEPQQIIAMFAWQLHVLALVKTAGDRDSGAIAREAKLNPYVVGKTATLARRVSLGDVRTRIEELLAIDLRGKRSSLDLDAALQHFILRLAA